MKLGQEIRALENTWMPITSINKPLLYEKGDLGYVLEIDGKCAYVKFHKTGSIIVCPIENLEPVEDTVEDIISRVNVVSEQIDNDDINWNNYSTNMRQKLKDFKERKQKRLISLYYKLKGKN